MKKYQIRLYSTSKVIIINAISQTSANKQAKLKYPNEDISISEIIKNKTLSDIIYSFKDTS